MFWLDNINILYDRQHITNIFPFRYMSFDDKLNAMTRLIIVVSLFSYMINKNNNILVCGFAIILAIIFLHKSKKNIKPFEGFSSQKKINNFENVSQINPLGNTSLVDIQINQQKPPAPPSFDSDVVTDINENTKNFIVNESFENDMDMKDKLFKDLSDDMTFEQSMRNFYSNPNTEVVPGDQHAYAQFLYGNMPSCRGGDTMACETPSLINY